MSASPRTQQKRTAHTCITCRARKVRCDGRKGTCTNCERLGFGCSYDEHTGVEVVQTDAAVSRIAIPRRRVRRACQNCHEKKARCSGSTPSCDRCTAQGLHCVYLPGKRSLPLASPATASAASATSAPPATAHPPDSPSYDDGHSGRSAFASGTASPAPASATRAEPEEDLVLRAFDAFFRHVHHIPKFSFLHRASLMERYHAGSLDRSLVLALIAITALLTDLGPGMGEYGSQCMEEAVSLCLAGLEKPSIVRLQALVIAVEHRIFSRRFSGAFMLHALASRFATALRLNYENPELCFLARESRRRLMWSLYMIDSSISAGQRDVALWPDAERQIHVHLPCNERNFEFDLPEATESLRPPPPEPGIGTAPMPDALGFMALHVRIQWMRARILQCTSQAASSWSQQDLTTLPLRCAELLAELEGFEERLPPSFKWSEGNLRLRTYSPRLGIFVMTHVWWRQCHLDLYRLFLEGLREALPRPMLQQLDPNLVARSRQGCYNHARAMADMFAQLLTLGSSVPVTDLDLPGCAYQCTRALYHGLQTGTGDLAFTLERVQELSAVCLRAAQQSTTGPAAASIQADIERIITHGLKLPEGAPDSPTRNSSDPAPVIKSAIDTRLAGHAQLTPDPAALYTFQPSVPATSAPSIALPSLAVTEPPIPAPVAPSHASGVTTGSNAFEEVLSGFTFGPELYGMDWSTFPTGWPNQQFTGSNM
ncbi:hypothetical protein QC762_000930 [Podospora pseudocomata]|uniref:Zn(2)-C6 fungal-type domain-containing protein n=1 Tax=Podospora pseudocomata TaxID=2093779 RepID=A0ABR0GPD8_9PEZI|nr:hypothetical protein QC762_000930 [Podospora pseudocomata]